MQCRATCDDVITVNTTIYHQVLINACILDGCKSNSKVLHQKHSRT